MPTFLPSDEFQSILEVREKGRRVGLAKRLYADFEAGALDLAEKRAALSIFRSITRDDETDVRHEFARFVSRSHQLPTDIAMQIADDAVRRVAAPFLRHGTALDEDGLVDCVGGGEGWRQVAIAGRHGVSLAVSAAIAEVGDVAAIVVLLKNSGALVSNGSIARIAERFGMNDAVAELLLQRPGVPDTFVEARIHTVSDRLKAFVGHTGWMAPDMTSDTIQNAVEHSLVEFASDCSRQDLLPIFARWVAEGRVTRGFVLRAACYGALIALELALSEFAGLPPRRAAALWQDRRGYGRQSLIARSGFNGEEEAFIIGAIRRFTDARPDQLRRDSRAWRKTVALGLEEVVTDGATTPEFAALMERFAIDCGLVVVELDHEPLELRERKGQTQRPEAIAGDYVRAA